MQHEYLRDAGLARGARALFARWLMRKARLWDSRTANAVDHFIANSRFIANRIWRVYRREADVIHPPVDVNAFALREQKEDFYLTASRLVSYKKVPAIVEAFRSLPDRRLVVVGDGADMKRVKTLAGPNVEILGYQSPAVLRDLMQRAKAFVFAAEEDFGIAPVEAQACGTPVNAYARGGALETIRGEEHAQPTGVFFGSQHPAAIAAAVRELDDRKDRIEPRACRDSALRFSVDAFKEQYARYVRARWDEFRSGGTPRAQLEREKGRTHH
jgi:glycosyltransferase involved in cell wall biosynthesis